MVIILLFVAACIVILIFALKDEFEWDMFFPLLLTVASAAIVGIVVSSSVVTTAPNEYQTKNIAVVNDNIYYDGFQPIVYIYNDGELEKFRPSRVVHSVSAKKPVVIEVTSTNDGIIALGDYYKFKVLLIPKK
jgi:hypothetical protein